MYLVKVCIITIFVPHIICQLATWPSDYDSPVIKEPRPGWARFCKGDKAYDTFANQCPVGVFWDESHDNTWDCVCTRGPWRRSAGWCSAEDTQRFTQGDITCFQPDAEEKQGMQGLFYVGDRFSAWDSSLPVLLTDYRSGIPIRKAEFSSEWEVTSRSKMTPGILIYRPRDDWTVQEKINSTLRLCLRAPAFFDDSTEGLFIYNVSQLFDPSGAQQTLQLSFNRGCYSWNDHDKTVWYEVIGENLEHKNMVVPPYNSNTSPAECIKCMTNPIPPTPEASIDGGPLEERDELTIYDLRNVAVLKTDIDLQTERLGLYWAHRMLKNGTDYVTGNFQELEILSRAAIMALNVCDSKLIPKEFYQYFLIMFRMLLADSFKKYAPKGPINYEYYVKINEIFDKCRARSAKINFELSPTCPRLFTRFDGKNASQEIDLTPDYTSDRGRHDYLLEFVWRLKSFLHYNCFEEFEKDSILHDVVQTQLESLFTEDLILRWYNPANSYLMYQQIFSVHFDLEVTMRNFQRCVIAVHDLSKFPVWLKRPIDRPETRPGANVGLDGVVPRYKRSVKSPKTGRKRSKREENDYDYEEGGNRAMPQNNLFDGSAACIQSIRKFMTESNKTADSNCW